MENEIVVKKTKNKYGSGEVANQEKKDEFVEMFKKYITRDGADKLLGNGDLLFLNSVTNQIIRGHGTFVSDDEIYAVNCEISTDRQKFLISDEDFAAEIPQLRHFDDPLYEEAVSFIVTQRRASTSLLQRKFSIGYRCWARRAPAGLAA